MTDWQWLLLAALVLLNAAMILVAAVVLRLYARRQGRAGGTAGTSERGAQVGRDVEELIDQLDRLAADIDRRLEAREQRLRELLAEADERIAALRRLEAGPRSAGAGPPGGQRTEEILRLCRQQLDPVEIARRVGMDVGEVELVLNLSRSAGLAGAGPARPPQA